MRFLKVIDIAFVIVTWYEIM